MQSAEKSKFGTGLTKGRRACDPWWRTKPNGTRLGRDSFLKAGRVVHQADNGEKHIADVKTDQGVGN